MENIMTINRKKINYFKLVCVSTLIMSLPFNVSASTSVDSSREVLSVTMQNRSIKDVFSYIEKNSDYVFIYEGDINLNRMVDVNISNKSVEEIIKEVFSANGLSYTIKGRQVIVKNNHTNIVADRSTSVTQNSVTVRGTVTDAAGLPLPGVNIIVKGTTIGTMTDENGKFELPNAPANGVLVFSYIGYKESETNVRGQVSIVLYEDSELLNEVVVVGYGTQKKVNMTGAVSTVKVYAMEDRPITNATNALAGLAAGLSVTNSGGNVPGYEAQTIRIRGTGTLNNSDPLIVIDGMTNVSISDINP